MRKLLIPVVLAVLGVCGLTSRFLIPDAQAAQPDPLYATTETKDWGSLADGAGATEDMVAEGATLGDYCVASMSIDIQAMIMTCAVKSAGVITVRLQNETTGTIDLASGSLRAVVIKRPITGRGS